MPSAVRRRMRPGSVQQASAETLARFANVLQRAYAPPPDPRGWRDAWPPAWPFNDAWPVNRKEYSWPEQPAHANERRRRGQAQDWVAVRVARLPAELRHPVLLPHTMSQVATRCSSRTQCRQVPLHTVKHRRLQGLQHPAC